MCRKKNETLFNLTSQEFKVMEMVAKGYSNREITNELFIQPTTLKTHLIHIYQKLGFVDNSEIAGGTLRVRVVLKWQQYKKEVENLCK